MKPEEMKIGETVPIHEMGGKTYRLLPEKDIVKYLRTLEKCPFCSGENIEKWVSYGSLILACEDCGFQITSSHLYHHSRVEKGMQTIKDVVSGSIKEAVKEHEQELMKKLTFVTLKLDRIKEALDSHFAL